MEPIEGYIRSNIREFFERFAAGEYSCVHFSAGARITLICILVVS